MLKMALNILIDNAICYTPARSHIAVKVSLQAKRVMIAVRDDSLGIAPPEYKSFIFVRFYRADNNSTDSAHNGLDLSIAKKMVNNHGGELTYKTAERHGSMFYSPVLFACSGSVKTSVLFVNIFCNYYIYTVYIKRIQDSKGRISGMLSVIYYLCGSVYLYVRLDSVDSDIILWS